MLSPAIPCHYHDTDLKMRDMLVRHLGALRRAVHSLELYYHNFSGSLVSPSHNPFHPYPTSFTTQDGLVKRFKYHSSMKGRTLFFGNIDDKDGAAICVKFVTRYCEQAHSFLAISMFPVMDTKPPALLRREKAIYPYWKEHQIERAGHRIMPLVGFHSVNDYCQLIDIREMSLNELNFFTTWVVYHLLSELSNISMGSGKWHGFSSLFRVPGCIFSASIHPNFRQLFSPVVDTNPPAL